MSRDPDEDPSYGRLRVRLRESISRNVLAHEPRISQGAWDAICRKLDSVVDARPVVLIVEDDVPTMRQYVRGIREDCDVLEAPNATRAKEIIEESPKLSLVILDLNLPDGSGYDVASYLRRTPRFEVSPEILVISAYVNEQIKKLFERLPGKTSFVEKVSPDLIGKIRRKVSPPWGTPKP